MVAFDDFSSTLGALILACCGVMVAILAVMGDIGTVGMHVALRNPDFNAFMLTGFLTIPFLAFGLGNAVARDLLLGAD